MDGWSVAGWLIVGYVSLLTLVKFMLRRREAMVGQLRRQVQEQTKRRNSSDDSDVEIVPVTEKPDKKKSA